MFIILNCIFVGAGGFIGAITRYLFGLIPIKLNCNFPIKTLAINVIGSFIIGIISIIAIKNKNINSHIILMFKVGFCGGFTTFSTFAYESMDLIKGGNILFALLYIMLSVLLSFLAIYVSEIIIR